MAREKAEDAEKWAIDKNRGSVAMNSWQGGLNRRVGRRAEDRRQKRGDRRQETEDRRQKAEEGFPMNRDICFAATSLRH